MMKYPSAKLKSRKASLCVVPGGQPRTRLRDHPVSLFPEYLFILMIMYLAAGLTWALFNPVDASDTPSESIA